MNQLCGFALDLSSPVGTFTLYQKGAMPHTLVHQQLSGTFTHSEQLLKSLEACFQETGLSFNSIEEWVTPRGPGSFTGLRIAFSTLKAFARVSGKPLITVEGPEARAFSYLQNIPTLSWPPKLYVLSFLTSERYLITTFKNQGDSLLKVGEHVEVKAFDQTDLNSHMVVESRVPKKFYSDTKQNFVFLNLSSEHLTQYHRMKSTKVSLGEEIDEAVPSYFGSAHFD